MTKSALGRSVRLPSDCLHNVLLRNKQYRSWHHSPLCQVVHWAVLIAFTLGGLLGFSFNAALQPGEGRAAGPADEPVQVVVKEVVKDVVWDKGAENYITRGEFAQLVREVFGEHNLIVDRPNKEVRRVDALKLVSDLAGLEMGECQPTDFSDVDACGWYGPYVTFAVQNGLIEGSLDGLLRPYDFLRQSEAVKMVTGASRLVGLEL